MATRSIKPNVTIQPVIAPAAYAADKAGTAIDTLGYDSVALAIQIGAWTDGSHAFIVKESATGVRSPDSFSAVADADLDGTEPTVTDGTDDGTVVVVGYKGSKRYVTVDLDYTQTASPEVGMTSSVSALLGHPHQRPTA